MPGENTAGLLATWEEVYKKGLLTFWLLLLLHERPSYPYEIGQAIRDLSQGAVSADDNSIYRALGRFETVGLVQSDMQQSSLGPPRRYYRLTQAGLELLVAFIQRNILIFSTPAVAQRIQKVFQKPAQE